MEEPSPPTHHVLRPHHIAILAVFVLIYKDRTSRPLPPPFVLHAIRLLLNEVSEVSQPLTFQELIQELSAGPKADSDEPKNRITAMKSLPNELQAPDSMTLFFLNMPSLFIEKMGDYQPPFTRRSIFGYFCRRCVLSFIKLSFSGVVKLQKDFKAWCEGDRQAGYDPIVKDQLNCGDLHIFRTRADKKIWAQPEAYRSWEKGNVTGDENIATENLRRFFEQHFHENNDSGIRQHALLNIVRMHYVRGEYVAAEKLLHEAISVSRSSGDKLALQHCISLLNRLPPKEPGQKPVLNEIQPDLHPQEVLFDVQKLMQIPNEQPLSAAFEKIVQAIGLYDHLADTSFASVEAEQWSQHTMQSIVWSAAGCDRLAAIEENIVTAFTEVGGDDNNRLTVTLNRAYRRARQGEYDEALCSLLEPDVWRGLSFDDYVTWANEIWHILVLKASRGGNNILYRNFLRTRHPPRSYNPKHYFYHATSTKAEMIHDQLYDVVQLRRCDHAAIAVEQLLTALWHSEFQLRLNFYRTGIIFLADLGLEFGMTKRCRTILEEIMPQIIGGTDLEQRALACFNMARSIMAIAADETNGVTLQEALFYLQTAESDYKRLRMFRQLMDVQYLLSIVYHNLGLESERDAAIKKHLSSLRKLEKFESMLVDEKVKGVWEVVTDVGAALASR